MKGRKPGPTVVDDSLDFRNTDFRQHPELYRISKRFLANLQADDFPGVDLARQFLQMGRTRARRYANPYEGDLYDLAVLLLKLYDAKAERDGQRGRPTVHGVSSAYARLMIEFSTEQVEARIKEHDLPLGAVVDWEGEPA